MLNKNFLFFCAAWSLLLQSPCAAAQTTNTNIQGLLVFTSQIRASTCVFALANSVGNNRFLFQLPELRTNLLNENNFGPVSRLDLSFQSPVANPSCTLASGARAQLVFDSALAAVAPRTGLLRNTATNRPAQNVFMQLGLIGQDGSFGPLDLNQPQALNQALTSAAETSPSRLNLTLGIRYVASRSFNLQTANLQALSASATEEVSAGNVAVFLPFLLKLN